MAWWFDLHYLSRMSLMSSSHREVTANVQSSLIVPGNPRGNEWVGPLVLRNKCNNRSVISGLSSLKGLFKPFVGSLARYPNCLASLSPTLPASTRI